MEYSIGILLLLLFLLLFVAHMSHPLSRRFLTEGFVVDYTKPSVDLTTEPDFMAFYTFHGQVCALWNAIIEEVMKNDCVDPANPCPAKPAYIAKMKELYNTANKDSIPICFIDCDKAWDAKSSLEDLLEAVPETIKCYTGTLTFVLNKSNEIIKQVNEALSQIPPQGFTDYQTQITCSILANGTTQCKDSKGDIYMPQKQQQQQQQQQQSQASASDAAKKQLAQTNQIIGRCRIMNTEIPKLKQLLEQAKKNVELLKEVKKKAQDGSLLPPPAKT
jgi:hypothetical protein